MFWIFLVSSPVPEPSFRLPPRPRALCFPEAEPTSSNSVPRRVATGATAAAAVAVIPLPSPSIPLPSPSPPSLAAGEPVSTIISKLEEIANVVRFTVRKKDCRVSLEGTREGEKGPLTIAAEIFELTPSLVVVEVKKKAGDRDEYEEFCNRELKPGLQNLIYGSHPMANIASDTE